MNQMSPQTVPESVSPKVRTSTLSSVLAMREAGTLEALVLMVLVIAAAIPQFRQWENVVNITCLMLCCHLVDGAFFLRHSPSVTHFPSPTRGLWFRGSILPITRGCRRKNNRSRRSRQRNLETVGGRKGYLQISLLRMSMRTRISPSHFGS